MTNAEAIIEGLQMINEDHIAECVSDYINCPSSPDCAYDGRKDLIPCLSCKIKWLREEWKIN